MEAVEAYYDGRVFVPRKPISARKNQSAIVTILDEFSANRTKKTLLSLVGALSEEDATDFMEALKDTEQVDANEW
jgi:hypothetical protein